VDRQFPTVCLLFVGVVVGDVGGSKYKKSKKCVLLGMNLI